MKRWAALSTPDGAVIFAASGERLSHVHLTGRGLAEARALAARTFPDATRDDDLLPDFPRQLRDYFAGRRVAFDVDVDLTGLTSFQQRVLEACARVDYGERVSYGELARRVGRPNAARAVGGALARNPVPLAVPCHRVVAGDGSLGGFSAEQGLALKRKLLELERNGNGRHITHSA